MWDRCIWKLLMILIVAMVFVSGFCVLTSADSSPESDLNIEENVSWAKIYGSSKTNEGINSIQQTEDDYVVAGWIGDHTHYSIFNSNKDLWVAKLDSNGSIVWQRAYGESESEEAYSIQPLNDGYIVAGYRHSARGNKNVWILKLDKNGDIEWQKEFDWGDRDMAYCIKQTEDSGYIVIGETGILKSEGENINVLDSDVWILKLDEDGTIEWQRAYGGKYTEKAYSIIQTSRGRYAFVLHMGDAVLCELRENGDIIREKEYIAWNYDDKIYSIKEIDDGYILAGWTNSFGAGKDDLWVIKTSKLGSLMWQKSYGGSEDDKAYSILPTDDGYIVAGTTKSFGNGCLDAWILKLDDDGNIRWQKSYGGSEDDEIRQILPVEDGYIVSGYTQSFGFGNGDAWVFKLDKDGNIGNCTMVQETNAVVTPTSAESTSWPNKKKEDTNAKVAITSSAVSDTNFQTQTICQNSKLS